MKTEILPPGNVARILNILEENGYEAYAVGGCIRDSVLGRQPKDWDITTNALPSAVSGLFSRTIDTGLKHGTVTIMLDGQPFEVTTFRIDGKYEDSRHPNSVEFTGRLEEDLCRRDFTINAMAWNEKKGLIDLFGGLEDISAGLIRTVGNPDERFREDALRMLRAVRFAARLGFEIHSETFRAIEENRGLILNISSERIREELTGILTSETPLKFRLLSDAGLLELILPEIEVCFHTPQHNPHHVYNVGDHSLQAVAAIENDRCLRWAMLLHDSGKPGTRTTDEKGIDHFYGHPVKSVELTQTVLERLRFDRRSMERIIRLILHHDRDIQLQPKAVARAVRTIGEDLFLDLLKVKKADSAAQNPSDRQKNFEYIDNLEKIYYGLKAQNSCLKLKDMAITGNDLIAMGFSEGREIGRTLDILFEKVLDDPALNQKERLSGLVAELLEMRGNTGPDE